MDLSERFARNLVAQREKAGMSQEELAFRANLHRTQISLNETGKRRPRLDTLVKLAGALGISPEDLLEGISWDPNAMTSGNFKVAE